MCTFFFLTSNPKLKNPLHLHQLLDHKHLSAIATVLLTMPLYYACRARRRALVGLSEEVVAGMCWRRAGGLDTQPEGGQDRVGEEEREIRQ